jgi:hypothetical protein
VECLLYLLGSKEAAEVEKQQNVTDSQSHLLRKNSILKNPRYGRCTIMENGEKAILFIVLKKKNWKKYNASTF